jgi:hypothetical protein
MVFLRPRANAELVPKFHVALHASHAALPTVTIKISPCTNVTLTLGWITLFMGLWVREPYTKKTECSCRWGPAPRRTGRQTVGCNITWNWTCIIALQITDAILSSERVPYMKNKESNCHSKKCNIRSPAPKGAWHQDELADRPSVAL